MKRLQDTYAQYSQFGLWNEMAALRYQVRQGKIFDIVVDGTSRSAAIA